MTPESFAFAVAKKFWPTDPIDGNESLETAIAAAIREAVEHEQRSFLLTIGARVGETLHDLILRKQREVNELRETAVAAEREACAVKVEEQGQLLKSLLETDRYDTLIRDLAKAIRQ